MAGFWRGVFTGQRDPATSAALAPESPSFAVTVDPGTLYGVYTLDDFIFRMGHITRAEALRVPAVKRARDLICGAIGQFPLGVYDPAGKPATTFTPNLFQQPEPGVAAPLTWTHVVEDMLFDERSWLNVITKGWHGRPIEVNRLEADTVTVQPEYRRSRWGTAKVWPQVEGLIRIDSPNPGLLDNSAAIRACVALERASLNYIDGSPPMDYFTPADDNADPFQTSDEVRDKLLDPWAESRRTRSTGYVPAGVKYNIAGWDPDKLQLASAREFAITEVARLTGIDAEELSISTTSRTYFNGQDRRRQRVEDVLGPYMTAIEGRLSQDDVTPRGFTVKFDPSAYLRLDDLSAAQTDSMLIAAKVITPDEARAKRSLEPRGDVAAEPEPDSSAISSAVGASVAIQTAQAGARRG